MLSSTAKYTLVFFLLGTTSLYSSDLANADTLKLKKKNKINVLPASSSYDRFPWEGFHIGVGGGVNLLQSTSEASSAISTSNSQGYFNESYTQGSSILKKLHRFGGFASVHGGVDTVSGSLLVGAFANYDMGSVSVDSNISDTTTLTSQNYAPSVNSLDHEVSLKNRMDFGGRVGHLVNESTLAYALGGVSVAKISAETNLNVVHDPASALADFSLSTKTNEWKSGYMVGAGLEFAISKNTTLKTEYRFADYGTIKSSASNSAEGDGTASISQKDDVKVHSIRAVLSYHF